MVRDVSVEYEDLFAAQPEFIPGSLGFGFDLEGTKSRVLLERQRQQCLAFADTGQDRFLLLSRAAERDRSSAE